MLLTDVSAQDLRRDGFLGKVYDGLLIQSGNYEIKADDTVHEDV